jgi:2-iminobutanoate/2-iminopropanoate deaminase
MEISKKVISTDKAPAAIGPYSQAIDTGVFIYTSGQIPVDPSSGVVVQGGIEEQTKQVFENLRNVLEAAGSGLDQIVKTTVFLKDMGDFAKVNEIYATYFTTPYPARSCVEVAALPKGVMIEVEAVATKLC